jgi:S-DNA-T family DNA segregation ATPase FtsK/SpoIIIE
VVDPRHGVTAANPALRGARGVPLGEIDVPRRQSREVMWVDLDGATGNIAVAGRPQSGKSNLLRTFVIGLALTHTPAQAQVYCLDFGSGLAVLRGLPHVGTVAGRRDVDLIQRCRPYPTHGLRTDSPAGGA